MTRIDFIGLGGNSFAPLQFGLYASNALADAAFVLVDGKEYRPGHEDHEFFLRHGPKVVVQAGMLHSAYPSLSIIPIPLFVDRDTTERTVAITEVVQDGDAVVLSVDNHETRRLVTEHAMTLPNVTLISGAIDGEQVHVWVYLRRNGTELTPSPLHRYPELASASTALPAAMLHRTGCLEAAVQKPAEERPNYFALLSMSALMLSALWHMLTLDANGRIEEFPYVDTWLNVATATATPNHKE